MIVSIIGVDSSLNLSFLVKIDYHDEIVRDRKKKLSELAHLLKAVTVIIGNFKLWLNRIISKVCSLVP